jgi:hypothetical protein
MFHGRLSVSPSPQLKRKNFFFFLVLLLLNSLFDIKFNLTPCFFINNKSINRYPILHKTKKRTYQALVQSILLYGAETWTLNTQQANKLLATEMDFWRRSARKSRKEKVRNVTIERSWRWGRTF